MKAHRNRPGLGTKLRHWLIRKLSCGDLIMMNFDVRSDGAYARRNAGQVLVSDFSARVIDQAYMIGIGPEASDAVLHFSDKSHFLFLNGHFDSRPLGHVDRPFVNIPFSVHVKE